MKTDAKKFSAGARVISAALLLFVSFTSVVSDVGAAPPDPEMDFATGLVPSEASRVDDVSRPLTGGARESKLDTRLAEVSRAAEKSMPQALALAEQMSLKLSGRRVQVHIVIAPSDEATVKRLAEEFGGEVTGTSIEGQILQAWVPVSVLKTMASNEEILMMRQPEPAMLFEDAYTGSSSTEALSVINAPSWHSEGYDGTEVKVGVIDAGFEGYTDLLGTDLPGAVTVENFVDGESDAQVDGTTVHGTGCAEIVHDIAPSAQLFLAKVGTNIDLQEAVVWLRDTHHVDVITTSLGWYNVTPGDGTGFFADMVNAARSAGIFWSTAAGNDRQAHWGGTYNDANGDGDHDFDGVAQDVNYFGPGNGDAYYIPEGWPIRIYMRWDDWVDVNQDYDLYLYQWDDFSAVWREVAYSEDAQNGSLGQSPIERISYTAVDEYGDTSDGYGFYGFAVERWFGDRDVNIETFAPKVDRLDEIVPARSLANLADAPDAITVAAADVSSPFLQEYYSSEGPTNGPGGTAAGGAVKPDISGYAQVSTESYGAGGFTGTSAATPHVAGAAALVLDACPTCTPDQVEAFLTGRAVEMGADGLDTQYGHGRLDLGDPPTFEDVAINHWAFDWIEALYASGITSGCSSNPMNYCPGDSVTRAQMAVFLERGMRGSGYTPPSASGEAFDDVSAGHWAADWIEQLASDGITSGCSTDPPLYCPEYAVERAQMAVFLERAGHWPDAYTPPAASGALFGDVPASHWAADWIEQLYTDGITSGCSLDPLMYCPESSVTRAQMAVFLVRTFNLPL